LKKKDCVKALDLIPHPEGGYFRETHRSGATPMASRGKTDSNGDLVKTSSGGNARNTMTSIYYLIEDYQGLVCNKSDHVHYFHYGCTVLYHIVNPSTGEYYVERLGSNLSKGDKPQVVVPGNYFKAATLEKTKSFDFALLGEGVGPGFDFRDFEFVSKEKLKRNLSNKSNFFVLERLCKPGIEDTDKFYEKTDNNNKKNNKNKNNTNNNRNGSSDKLSKGKDISAPGLKKIPTPKIGGGQSTNAVAAPVNGEAKSPQPPLPPSPPPPNALRTTPNGNTVLADRKLTRSMATNPQIRFDDIGQSTPQFKPPKNINRIDRDNVEITPMGLKTRPEEDEGDKSLELESPL
jgi:predicted cupin superfamily sugar epimerase